MLIARATPCANMSSCQVCPAARLPHGRGPARRTPDLRPEPPPSRRPRPQRLPWGAQSFPDHPPPQAPRRLGGHAHPEPPPRPQPALSLPLPLQGILRKTGCCFSCEEVGKSRLAHLLSEPHAAPGPGDPTLSAGLGRVAWGRPRPWVLRGASAFLCPPRQVPGPRQQDRPDTPGLRHPGPGQRHVLRGLMSRTVQVSEPWPLLDAPPRPTLPGLRAGGSSGRGEQGTAGGSLKPGVGSSRGRRVLPGSASATRGSKTRRSLAGAGGSSVSPSPRPGQSRP